MSNYFVLQEVLSIALFIIDKFIKKKEIDLCKPCDLTKAIEAF